MPEAAPDILDLIRYREEYFGRNFRRINDFFIAKVISIDDPKKKGRVCVRIFGIHPERDASGRETDESVLPWAEPAFFASGNNYGDFSLPAKNDFVWVTFIEGDYRRPIWFGSLTKAPNDTSQLPQEFQDDQYGSGADTPQIRGFYTPKGHKFVVRDKAGDEEIVIQTKNGVKLVLRDSPQNAGSGEDAGVTLAVNDQTRIEINGSGSQVTIKVSGDCNVEASGNIFLGNSALLPTAGVVTGENIDPFTGKPFPDHSQSVRAKQ